MEATRTDVDRCGFSVAVPPGIARVDAGDLTVLPTVDACGRAVRGFLRFSRNNGVLPGS